MTGGKAGYGTFLPGDGMKKNTYLVRAIALPAAVAAILVALWTVVWKGGAFHPSAFPSPLAVARGFGVEIASGRLFSDTVTSLFRVTCWLWSRAFPWASGWARCFPHGWPFCP